MAESRFIRTVVFGGYDKGDVDKKFDYLYSQYYEMKNSLRETKLLLNKYKEGADDKEAVDSVLANERTMLSALQVTNENLTEKNKSMENDLKAKEQENEELKARVEQLEKELNDANNKLAATEGGDSAMLSVVFAEAQKSANMIISTAKQQAEDLEANSEKLALNTVDDANNKASKIIYDAEVEAAKITADAKNDQASMEVASGNLRASMLSDISKVGVEIAKLRKLLDDFDKSGMAVLTQSEEMLDSTQRELLAGGVPMFKEPELVEAKLPEEPKYKEIDNTYPSGEVKKDEDKEKKNRELDKLKSMADAIGGGKAAAPKEEKPAKKHDLSSLKKQAAELAGNKPKTETKKSGGLSELLNKAKSIK